jgi:hypothetical protein
MSSFGSNVSDKTINRSKYGVPIQLKPNNFLSVDKNSSISKSRVPSKGIEGEELSDPKLHITNTNKINVINVTPDQEEKFMDDLNNTEQNESNSITISKNLNSNT